MRPNQVQQSSERFAESCGALFSPWEPRCSVDKDLEVSVRSPASHIAVRAICGICSSEALISHSYETLMTRDVDFSLYRKSARRFADNKMLAAGKSAELWKRQRFSSCAQAASRDAMRMPTSTRTG
jgi:hypothetical protein